MATRKKTTKRKSAARRVSARRRPAKSTQRRTIRRTRKTAAYARTAKAPKFAEDVKDAINAAIRDGRALRRDIERRVDHALREIIAKKSGGIRLGSGGGASR